MSRDKLQETSRVLDFLCSNPRGFTTLKSADTKALLLETDGTLLCGGTMYEIVAKHLGAGVYRISLREPVR